MSLSATDPLNPEDEGFESQHSSTGQEHWGDEEGGEGGHHHYSDDALVGPTFHEDNDGSSSHAGGGPDAIGRMLADAFAQLPQTLLHLEDPLQLTGISAENTEADRMNALAPYLSPLIQSQASQVSDRPVVTTTDKILNAVLPPRTFSIFDAVTGGNVDFVQCVSSRQATRNELSELRELFEFKLHDSKARLIGICPVRAALYDMLADELLRQVTIDQPERGLLLRRVRDEARMTLEAYQSLHGAASQYGAKKLLEGAMGVPQMQERIARLTSETDALHKQLRQLEARHASLLRCVEEQVQADTRRHNEEKAFLENSKKRLQQHLEAVKQAQEQERRALMGE